MAGERHESMNKNWQYRSQQAEPIAMEEARQRYEGIAAEVVRERFLATGFTYEAAALLGGVASRDEMAAADNASTNVMPLRREAA